MLPSGTVCWSSLRKRREERHGESQELSTDKEPQMGSWEQRGWGQGAGVVQGLPDGGKSEGRPGFLGPLAGLGRERLR